jgi:hypothetical protein
VRTYLVECEITSRDPAIAANSTPISEGEHPFAVGKDAVAFARKWVAVFAGDGLPRATVMRRGSKLRGAAFTCWRTPAGEVRERRHVAGGGMTMQATQNEYDQRKGLHLDMMHSRQPQSQSSAQKLAVFLNAELSMPPERVNAVIDVLRREFPQVMWDIPEEA